MSFNEPNSAHGTPVDSDRKTIFDLNFKKLEGLDKQMIVLGGDNLPGNELTCIEEADAELFLANDAKLQNYASGIENNPEERVLVDPLLMELVLVKDNSISRWVRAAFVAKHGNKLLLHAIDYGITFLADNENIRVFNLTI